MSIVVIIFICIGLFLGYQAIVNNLMKPPKDYPNLTSVAQNKKILVCAGDSITHGNVSYNWVKDVRSQLPDYQVFNAGINADLSYTLHSRLDDIIAVKPDHIHILIGGNDIVARAIYPLKKNDRYITFNKIPWGVEPSLASYQSNLQHIIQRLKKETTATISIMSIAPITEDVQAPIYKMVEKYNEVVKNIAYTEGVVYLPLHETMNDYLQQNSSPSPIPFEKTRIFTVKAVYLNTFLRWDWDKITQMNKQLLTFDNLHFNSIGGKMIGDLLLKQLKK